MRVLTAAFLCLAGIAGTAPQLQAQKRVRELIKREEIMASPQRESDLYAAIQALRPHFFEKPKGTRSITGMSKPIADIVVYFGPLKQPGLEALHNVMAYDVEEVRFLDAYLSESRYGVNANGGAIVVKINPVINGKTAPSRSETLTSKDTIKPPTR